MEKGFLIVNVYADNIALPVNRARVEVVGQNIVVYTGNDGKTPVIELDAPDKRYSQTPQENVVPYSVYDIKVTRSGLVDALVKDVQIFPDEVSLQDVYMVSSEESSVDETVVTVDAPTLWGDYAPNLEDVPLTESTVQDRVLPSVIIPEYIVVHDGVPTSSSASQYYVSFPDYIKNVTSSEIYSTWPTETIKANVAAIVSFTLNRIYTEWYRSRGYNFTITSTTSYDQKYTHGRTIFKSISDVVDNYFNQYIRIGTATNPFFAQYNDGINLNVAGRLNQWGSKSLGDQGYSALQILRYYYGSTAGLHTAPLVVGYPTSFPGYNMAVGSCGEEVQKMQIELNTIRGSYPGIPLIPTPDGKYDESTRNAVRVFQGVFSLSQTGIIDFPTWYKISYVYTAVSNMTKGIYS